jgi:hypothetical protein
MHYLIELIAGEDLFIYDVTMSCSIFLFLIIEALLYNQVQPSFIYSFSLVYLVLGAYLGWRRLRTPQPLRFSLEEEFSV